MSHIAKGFARTRRAAAVGAGALATLVALTTFAAPSALAATASTGSVTIKTSFENSPVSINTSDAVGYALTNTTGGSQTVSFTDTLPAGVTLDDPVGTTNTAGTGSCTLVSATGNPGDGAVAVTVTVPKETASGAVCTISFGVVAGLATSDTSPTDSFSGVSATPGAGAAQVTPTVTPGGLAVLASPALTFTAPTANQSFTLGQVSDASFGCAATDPLDTISSFFGTDDEGNQIESGAPIDTVDAGSHTLEVDCYSGGGGDVSQTIAYKVKANTLTAVKVAKTTDFVSFKTAIPAGKIVAKLLYGPKKTVIGTSTVNATSAKTASVTVKPTASGKKTLLAVKTKSAKVTLQVSFTPKAIGTGDQQITAAGATVVTRTVNAPIAKPKAKTTKKK